MKSKDLVRSIASQLIGICKTDLTTAESNIVEILLEANILTYVGKDEEVSWK